MRYVVIGAGAVGGTIGGRLHEAGRDVVLVARGAHLQALHTRGLRLEEPHHARTLRIPVAATSGEVEWGSGDVVIMATKTQASADLLDAVADAAPEVPVVCAQNGVANERLAADRFGHVLGICVMLPCEHLEPGLVVAYAAPTPGVLDVVSPAEEKERRGDLIVEQAVAGRERHGSSTWQSLHRGAGSVEAAYLNGEIVELGLRHGVATPANALLLEVVEEMARRGEAPGGRRAAELIDAIRPPASRT